MLFRSYRKAGYSNKFLAEHEEKILLHKAAKAAFDELGMEKLPTIESLKEEYAGLLAAKKEIYGEYRKVREEMRELQNVKANVERLLGMSEPQAEKEERDYGQR